MGTEQPLNQLIEAVTSAIEEGRIARLLQTAHRLDEVEQMLSNGRFEDAYGAVRRLAQDGDEAFAAAIRSLFAQTLDALQSSLFAQGRFEECLALLEEWARTVPTELYPRLRRAEILFFELKRTEEAVSELRAIIRRWNQSVEAWTLLAYTALSHRQRVLAVRYATRAWQALRMPVWAYVPYGEVAHIVTEFLYEVSALALHACGDNNRAKEVAQRGLYTLEGSDLLQKALERVQTEGVTRTRCAARWVQSLLHAIDDQLVVQLLKAARCCDECDELLSANRVEEAWQHLEQCEPVGVGLLGARLIELQRTACSVLVEAYRTDGDVHAELAWLERWLQKEPRALYPMLRRAEVLMEMEQYDEAGKLVRRLAALYPRCVEAHLVSANIHLQRRKNLRAVRALLRAWQSLSSAQWAYHPSRDNIRGIVETLATLTAIALRRLGMVREAQRILRGVADCMGELQPLSDLRKNAGRPDA